MIYVDLLIIQDMIFDYLILLCVGLILNRKISLRKIFFSSTIGTIPIIFLFMKSKIYLIIIISFIFSIIMSIITYDYKNVKYTFINILYMHLISSFLAGIIYLINTTLFPNIDNYFLKFIILIAVSPIITYIYLKSITRFKNNYSNYYQVDIYLKGNNIITVTAYLDTGNKLTDPYFKRPIILLNKKLLSSLPKKIILVPYNTVNGSDMLKCFLPIKIHIKGVGDKRNLLIGIVDKINLDGIDCILNSNVLERI